MTYSMTIKKRQHHCCNIFNFKALLAINILKTLFPVDIVANSVT